MTLASIGFFFNCDNLPSPAPNMQYVSDFNHESKNRGAGRGRASTLRVIVVMPWNSEFEFVATGAPWKAATLIARRFCR